MNKKHVVVEIENGFGLDFELDMWDMLDGAFLIPNCQFNGKIIEMPEWVQYIDDNAYRFIDDIQEFYNEQPSFQMAEVYRQTIIDDSGMPPRFQRKYTDDDIPVINDAINKYIENYELRDFADLLTALTNTTWNLYCIQGCSQGDWMYLMKPNTSSLDIRYFESMFFGMYNTYLIDDDYTIVVPYYDNLKNVLRRELGTNCIIELKTISGYIQVPTYDKETFSL